MAAKKTTLAGSAVVETVGTALNINRNPIAGAPPSVAFNVGFAYADHTYLVDSNGAKVKLLTVNENQKYVGLTPEQSGAFYLTPMKTADGTDTVLGQFIADLWDAAILADLAKPSTTPGMMPLR